MHTWTTDNTHEMNPNRESQQERMGVNKDDYEADLKRRQKEHLDSMRPQHQSNWRPCMHDECPSCVGTGRKKDGSACVHMISCPCPKCTVYC